MNLMEKAKGVQEYTTEGEYLASYTHKDVKDAIIDFNMWMKVNLSYDSYSNQKIGFYRIYFKSKYDLEINDCWRELGMEKIFGDFEK